MAEYEVYSDLQFEYKKDQQTSDFTKVINATAIKNSLRNILLTKKAERRMIPDFGAALEQMLFEPVDEITAKQIGKIIYDEIMYWETRIKLTNIEVLANPDLLRYDINIEYEVKTSSANLTSDRISFILGG